MIGNYEVIDAHCHIYPEKIAARACQGTDRFYGTTAACSGTTAGLKEILADGRIDRFLVHSVATTPRQVRSINDFIAAEVAAHPDIFSASVRCIPKAKIPRVIWNTFWKAA